MMVFLVINHAIGAYILHIGYGTDKLKQNFFKIKKIKRTTGKILYFVAKIMVFTGTLNANTPLRN